MSDANSMNQDDLLSRLNGTRNRKVFPNDDSARKVAYLAIHEASKRWAMPIGNWKPALNRFSIEFGERVTAHL